MSVRPLRIALVHPYSWPEVRRGAERYLDDLAWYLGASGHQVHVITGTRAEPSRVHTAEGVVVERHALPRGGRFGRRAMSEVEAFGLVALRRLVRRRFDVTHAFTPTAALAARAARQRTVYTVLGHPTRDQLGHRPLDERLMRWAVLRSTCATALSEASADGTAAVFGRMPVVLPPGVRLDGFAANLEPRVGPPRLLFSADASDRRKGLDVLLVAFASLLRHRPDARLALSGAGDPAWALSGLSPADGARVMPALDLMGVGTLGDLPSRYREATLTVLPARHEAFGLVLVESLAAGTPVVCARDGGMPEIVDDPAVGAVAPAGDPSGLADALEMVIDLAARPETPGRCAAHAQRWGWAETIGPLHERLYRSVCDHRGDR